MKEFKASSGQIYPVYRLTPPSGHFLTLTKSTIEAEFSCEYNCAMHRYIIALFQLI